jgi:lipopolysaccharide biosynthesis regulator YciM
MSQYVFLFVLLAFLVGVGAGKAWERYKLRNGRWIDRRRLRQTPHYMLGLNALVDHHVDQAIDELTQAISHEHDALELQMILGNLMRHKGQVAKAITLHQSLLQRPDLTPVEHAYVLLCLGLDFRSSGFVDRAFEAFREVTRLDPDNRYALVNLQRLYEDQQQWVEAAEVRARIMALDTAERRPAHRQILAFLRNQIGRTQLQAGAPADGEAAFRQAIDTDPATAPAYLNLGDARAAAGDLDGAVRAWEDLTRAVPDRSHLVFARLERAYASLGGGGRFVALCQRLIAQSPRDWRARLALSRHLAATGQFGAALDLLFDALPHHPHSVAIHQEVWRTLKALDFNDVLVGRYTDLTSRAVFYLDPHVCTTCRYRSTELLWQCPQCHDWNTFLEERMASARGVAEPAPVES